MSLTSTTSLLIAYDCQQLAKKMFEEVQARHLPLLTVFNYHLLPDHLLDVGGKEESRSPPHSFMGSSLLPSIKGSHPVCIMKPLSDFLLALSSLVGCIGLGLETTGPQAGGVRGQCHWGRVPGDIIMGRGG